MWSVALGIVLVLAGAALLLHVHRPHVLRAYAYRPRRTRRAARRQREREYAATEAWFREWRKQHPALLEETRYMPTLRRH